MSRLSCFLPHVMHEMAGDASDIHLPVEKRGADQSARTAHLLSVWRNGPENGHCDIVDIAAVDPEVGDAIAIIMFYLAQSATAYADQLGRPQIIEFLIDQRGSAHIPKLCFCCLSDQNMKLGDIIC